MRHMFLLGPETIWGRRGNFVKCRYPHWQKPPDEDRRTEDHGECSPLSMGDGVGGPCQGRQRSLVEPEHPEDHVQRNYAHWKNPDLGLGLDP